MKEQFAFCETVTASSQSKWHIRKLGEAGLKLGGGVDTKALCGREVAWDLNVELTEHHLEHNTCKRCRALYCFS